MVICVGKIRVIPINYTLSTKVLAAVQLILKTNVLLFLVFMVSESGG